LSLFSFFHANGPNYNLTKASVREREQDKGSKNEWESEREREIDHFIAESALCQTFCSALSFQL